MVHSDGRVFDSLWRTARTRSIPQNLNGDVTLHTWGLSMFETDWVLCALCFAICMDWSPMHNLHLPLAWGFQSSALSPRYYPKLGEAAEVEQNPQNSRVIHRQCFCFPDEALRQYQGTEVAGQGCRLERPGQKPQAGQRLASKTRLKQTMITSSTIKILPQRMP